MYTNGKMSNWLEIDLKAIENNVHFLRQYAGVQIMAVVKANGYGHGAIAIARAAILGGATWFGVARVEEALELRYAQINQPALVLGYTPLEKYQQAIEHNISLTIWSHEQLEFANQVAQTIRLKAKLHLKVDTGMSRLGIQVEQAVNLAQQIARYPHVDFEGLFTHFAMADELDPVPTDQQEAVFHKLVEHMHALGIHPKVIHTANSGALLTRPNSYYDLVRPGILIYGLHPSEVCPAPASIQPALSWKSVISHIKMLPPGRGVSYGYEYVTSRAERIGTVPVGYADGYRRNGNNIIIVGGVRVPVIGRVCMDQVMIQLDQAPNAQEGDEVILIGQQGNESIRAEEVGTLWHTNNYDVICGIGQRVPRIYI